MLNFTALEIYLGDRITMHLTADLLILDNPATAIERIVNFLRDYLRHTSADGFVIGMSGGLDSSVAAALCSRALSDPSKILGLCMPEEETYNETNIRDAESVARIFNIQFKKIGITSIIKDFYENMKTFDPKNRIASGNVKARIRAVTLFYHSNVLNRLVVGTTDKSEMMLG
jgi:NAD+ synthase